MSGQLHTLAALPPGERAPGTHWIGGSVGLRDGLDVVEKRIFLTLLGLELRPLGRPARSQSLYRLRYRSSYGHLCTNNNNIINNNKRITINRHCNTTDREFKPMFNTVFDFRVTLCFQEGECYVNVVPMFNCHEGVWGSGCIDPHFLHLGTSWRWVVSFTDPRAGLDDVEKKKILDPAGTRTPIRS
jgi:hypothetical protein